MQETKSANQSDTSETWRSSLSAESSPHVIILKQEVDFPIFFFFHFFSLELHSLSLYLSLPDKTALCWCGVCECGNASSLRSTDPNTLLKSSELFYLESAIYQVRCALFVEEGLQNFIGK